MISFDGKSPGGLGSRCGLSYVRRVRARSQTKLHVLIRVRSVPQFAKEKKEINDAEVFGEVAVDVAGSQRGPSSSVRGYFLFVSDIPGDPGSQLPYQEFSPSCLVPI